jgi:hypothetical protein
LLPRLDALRSDWLLGRRAQRLEQALVSTAVSDETPDFERLHTLVERLQHPRFAVRQAADQELRALGQVAAGFIAGLKRRRLSAEQRLRLRQIRQSLQVSGGDTPTRTAAWLLGDKRVWVAMLESRELRSRQVAADHLAMLTGKSLEFDALASPAERDRQVHRLRAQLGFDQTVLVGSRRESTVR